jgi:hypothetical protein
MPIPVLASTLLRVLPALLPDTKPSSEEETNPEQIKPDDDDDLI